MNMRLLIHISTLLLMFLIGIIFAYMLNISFLSEDTRPLFFNEQEVDIQTVTDEKMNLQQGIVERSFVQKLAMQLEKITSSFFNFILQILYEFSRMFYSNSSR